MFTEEHKRKLSEVRKKGLCSGKITIWNKGKENVYSKETLLLMSNSKKKMFEEHPEKKIETAKRFHGHLPWNKGKAWDEETKKKISRKLIGRSFPKKWREINKEQIEKQRYSLKAFYINNPDLKKRQIQNLIDYTKANGVWNKGIPITKERKDKQRLSLKRYYKNHPEIIEKIREQFKHQKGDK